MNFVKNPFFILVFISLFSMICEANAGWSFKKKYGKDLVYISSSQTRLVLNYKKNLSDNKKITKEFIKSLEKTKRKMLAQMGISKWKLKKNKLTELKQGVKRIILSGSYVNSQDEKIYFTEYYFYGPSKKLHLFLTNDSKRKLNRDARIKNIQTFVGKYEL